MGGEGKLRSVIDHFVDRMVDDVMIGFFFQKVNRQRLKDLEFQFAAVSLGAYVTYEGRPLEGAHARHGIMGGQFARRVQILKEVWEEHHVPAPVREAWLAHTYSLQPLITGTRGSNCTPQVRNGSGDA